MNCRTLSPRTEREGGKVGLTCFLPFQTSECFGRGMWVRRTERCVCYVHMMTSRVEQSSPRRADSGFGDSYESDGVRGPANQESAGGESGTGGPSLPRSHVV